MNAPPESSSVYSSAAFFSSSSKPPPCRITRYESKPSAALMSSLPFAAHISVGSHRDSLVSVRRYTQSWSSISDSNVSTSFITNGKSFSATGCPGIGIIIRTPFASTPGKIRRSFSAAAAAFGLPPSRQSSNSNSDCRTGLLKDTSPPVNKTRVILIAHTIIKINLPSTNVTRLTPHPNKHLATAHPSVPAPSNRHFVDATSLCRSWGRSLHRISLRLRSTACDASRVGSIDVPKSTSRGPDRPLSFTSQPTPRGFNRSDSVTTGRTHSNTMDDFGHTRPASLRTESTLTGVSDGDSLGCRMASQVRTLRKAQPGCDPLAHGSSTATVRRFVSSSVIFWHSPLASSMNHTASPPSRRCRSQFPAIVSARSASDAASMSGRRD